MTTKREQVIEAVISALRTIPGGPIVQRNEDNPVTVTSDGYIIVRDGDIGEPDIMLGQGPGTYFWTHRIDCETYVSGEDRHSKLDDLLEEIQTAIDADVNLGVLTYRAEPRLDEVSTLIADGVAPVLGAIVPIYCEYQTDGPLA